MVKGKWRFGGSNGKFGAPSKQLLLEEKEKLSSLGWCYLSYKNGYVRLMALHLLPLLNPWLIIKMWPAQVFSVGITLSVNKKTGEKCPNFVLGGQILTGLKF